MAQCFLYVILSLVMTCNGAFAATDTFGPWGVDASAPQFKDLSTCLASPLTSGKTIVIGKPMAIGNMTVNGNRQLKFIQGGRIDVAAGKTVTFASDASLDAGIFQIFSGAGSVAGLKESRPEWFGAPYGSSNSAPDAGPAIRAAMAALSDGGTLYVSGKHVFQTADAVGGLSIPNGVNVVFVNRWVSGFYAGNHFPAKPLLYSIGESTKRFNITNPMLQNFGDAKYSPGTSRCTDAFYGENVASSTFKNFTALYFFNGTGLKLDAPTVVTAYYNLIENPSIVAKYGVNFTGTAAANQANANTILGGEIIGIASSGAVSGAVFNGGVGSNYIRGTDISGSFIGPAIVLDNSCNNTIDARMELSQKVGANIYFDEKNGSKDNRINVNLQRPIRSSYLAPGSSWPGLTDTVQNVVLTGSQAAYTVPQFQATTIVIEVRDLTEDLRITLPNARNMVQGQTIRVMRSGITDDSAYTVVIQPNPNTLIDDVSNTNLFAVSVAPRNSALFTVNTASATSAKYLLWKMPDALSATPTRGFYSRGQTVLNSAPHAAGVPGWSCVFSNSTEFSAGASAGSTMVSVGSTAGAAAGDTVAMFHGDGTPGYYSVVSVNSASSLTITPALTKDVARGFQNSMNTFFIYRFKPQPNLGL
ncbi:hypothetical protein [Geomonas oryzae]|uniref:hypothetical protein n=1 Tax=Geomonas oryzae TaxID=2364273 RepID=UPI00100BCDE0|nr:hypothetical protein [Geomonas oryzae]